MSTVNDQIVRQDIGIALANISVGVMLAGTVAFAVEQWWVGVITAAVTGILTAAADRSRAGKWTLITVVFLSVVALGWGMLRDVIGIGVMPIVILGMGFGFSLNRFVFGVVQAVPMHRQQREKSA